MPELPEVETLRRELRPVLVGQKIKAVTVLEKKTIVPLTGRQLQKLIVGQTITGLSRRGKILIIDLTAGNHLLIHLKMTGQLIYRPIKGRLVVGGHPEKYQADQLPNRFTRLIIEFTGRSKLYFNDLRKFGWLKHLSSRKKEVLLNRNGLEPLAVGFTVDRLKAIFKKYPRRKIKQLLLDQNLIAGLGNIYADESLFVSGIRPGRLTDKITKKEAAKLHRAIINILRLSIKKKGASFRDYRRSDGRPGGFVPHLKVYGRTGQNCRVCRRPIKKIRLAGRGTHFCPNCQK